MCPGLGEWWLNKGLGFKFLKLSDLSLISVLTLCLGLYVVGLCLLCF